MSAKLRPIGTVSFFTGLYLLYGLRTVYAITGQISSENIARIEETKFQASIRLKDRDNPFGNGHICGGCAISHKTILTTAYCLFGVYVFSIPRLLYPYEISVVMGSARREERTENTLVFDIMEMNFHQKYKSKEFTLHRKYRPETFQNNVGLLFLKDEIPPGHPTVQPIPLASHSLQENKKCRLSGWGHVSPEGDLTNDLLIMTAEVLLRSTCKDLYKSGNFNLIKEGVFCAIDENDKDVCKVDSGAPLVCDNEVAGIVSWGIQCGVKGHPGVYTDVYHYKDWIYENGAHSINLNIVIFIKILSLLSLLSILEQYSLS